MLLGQLWLLSFSKLTQVQDPLKKADDAVELDTSYLDIDGVVEAIKKIVNGAK